MNTPLNDNQNGKYEVKQAFLANAITDISSYVQLIDTKVSIIMAAVVAIIVGILSGYDTIMELCSFILPCSWLGTAFLITVGVNVVSLICIFIFGILTIRSHSSKVDYKSKWFLAESTEMYSIDAYKADVLSMEDNDIIENMAVELYKLNDINRQKSLTYKWTLRSFTAFLITCFISICLIILSVI